MKNAIVTPGKLFYVHIKLGAIILSTVAEFARMRTEFTNFHPGSPGKRAPAARALPPKRLGAWPWGPFCGGARGAAAPPGVLSQAPHLSLSLFLYTPELTNFGCGLCCGCRICRCPSP